MAAALSPDGKYLLVGYVACCFDRFREYRILWDVRTGNKIRSFPGNTGSVTFLEFLRDGKQAISATLDGVLRVYDLASRKVLRAFRAYKKGAFQCAMTADGNFVLTAGSDDGGNITLKLWRIATGQLLKRIDLDNGGFGHEYLAISADHQFALQGGFGLGSKVCLCNLKTGKVIRTFPGDDGWAGPLAFSPDGKLALSTLNKPDGTPYGKMRPVLWEVPTGKVVRYLEGEGSWYGGAGWNWDSSALFTADGKQVFTWATNYSINFWDVQTGRKVRSLFVVLGKQKVRAPVDSYLPEVNASAFSHDGKWAALLTGRNYWDKTDFKIRIRVWDISGKKSKLISNWVDSTGARRNLIGSK
jgi:WD40 repeat protein